MTNRYVVQFNLSGAGNNGFLIAGSQGLTVVDLELSINSFPAATAFSIVTGNVIGTPTSTITPVPLHGGAPAALSSGVYAPLSGFGFLMGAYYLASTPDYDFRLLRHHPVVLAPGGNLLFQGPTGGSITVSAYVEE